MPADSSMRWCFTLNNYSEDDVVTLMTRAIEPSVQWLIFSKEVAPSTGTPHLQGFVIFRSEKRRTTLSREWTASTAYHWTKASCRDDQRQYAYVTKTRPSDDTPNRPEDIFEFGNRPNFASHETRRSQAARIGGNARGQDIAAEWESARELAREGRYLIMNMNIN